MLRKYKKDIFAIFIFLALAVIVQVIHYPVGTYDLSEDIWRRGAIISAAVDSSRFEKDPYLSDKSLIGVNPELSLHAPFLKLFKDYERYIVFNSFIYYFMGMALLYILVKQLTKDRIVAIATSICFSSSTIWFMPLGDIFAFIPIYSVGGKALSYLYFLLILIVYFRFKNDTIAILMCMPMLLIHPLTFLGPCAALIAYIAIQAFSKRELKKIIMSLIIFLIAILPYIILFLKAPTIAKDISYVDKSMFITAFEKIRPLARSPFSVFSTLQAYILRTNFLTFAASIPLLLLIKSSRRRELPRFFASLSFLVLVNTFILRLIGTYIVHNNRFFMINRNLKWMYFFMFLLFISLYDTVKENSVQAARPRLFRVNYLYALVIFIIFVQPIKNTVAMSNVGTKLLHKIAVVRSDEGLKNIGLDVRDINKDTDAVAEYILKKLPENAGLAGPLWINYKVRRGLVFSNDMDISFITTMKVDKYKKWKAISDNIELLRNNDSLSKRLTNLKHLGVDYILIEKFKMQQCNKFRKYIPDKPIVDYKTIREDFIEYENNNFLLLKTSISRKRGLADNV